MGRIWNRLKQEPNLVLTAVILFAIGTATATYLYVKKPSMTSGNVEDVIIDGLLLSGLAALFFFLRSVLTPRRSEAQETAANYEEYLGC